jgi:hypothetical protein
MELGVGRIGAILSPFVAGLLQQIYQTPTAMLLKIGFAAILAGVAVLGAQRTSQAGKSFSLLRTLMQPATD